MHTHKRIMTFPTRLHAHKKMHQVLFSAVLLLYYSIYFSAALEHHCIFDSIASRMGSPPMAVVLELPRRGRSGIQLMTASKPNWKPIRVVVFTEDMNDNSLYCTAAGDIRPNFFGGKVVCKKESILTSARREIILKEILPQATKLHSERLLVEPMTHPIVVPNNMSKPCSLFMVPSSHYTKGVKNVDMVLYAAAGPTEGRVLAWASPCMLHSKTLRPAVGVTNLDPKSATSKEFSVRVAAHEIAHALGFGSVIFEPLGMLTSRSGVRGKQNVTLVNTRKVVEKTRAQYDCPTALGMELEDEGGEGTAGSHWEARNAKDELMAPAAGVGYYSALTMAAFEDMGFYRANWSMAETMNWGRNAGCDLLEKKCVINGTTAYPDMFCTSREDKNIMLCTSDRLGLGRCDTKLYEKNLPPQYQYFINPRYGGDAGDFVDLCPLITPYDDTSCIGVRSHAIPGSRVGPTSRCLKGNELHYQGKRIGDVCVDVQCKHGSVSVRYLGNDEWHACPEGSRITPAGDKFEGTIVCPKYSEVCFETDSDRSEVDLGPMRVRGSDADAGNKPTSIASWFNLPLLLILTLLSFGVAY